MSQFYISSEFPEHDLQRCHRSREFRRWLAITGATEEGEIKLFEGVVQSVEDSSRFTAGAFGFFSAGKRPTA